jgi:hypothetical protein
MTEGKRATRIRTIGHKQAVFFKILIILGMLRFLEIRFYLLSKRFF